MRRCKEGKESQKQDIRQKAVQARQKALNARANGHRRHGEESQKKSAEPLAKALACEGGVSAAAQPPPRPSVATLIHGT
eukprot:6190244-Pleurochrysis_carterae.AAC.3